MSQRSVLLVDDEPSLLEGLRECLEDDGYDVHAALDGGEALAIFSKVHPELVVTDLRMPGMCGLEMIRRIREIDRNTAVIVMTAYGSVQSAVAALRLKVFDFISKPIELDQFRATLDRAIDESRETRRTKDEMAKMREGLSQEQEGSVEYEMRREDAGPEILAEPASSLILYGSAEPQGLDLSEQDGWSYGPRPRLFSAQLLAAQEEERKRIAGELHDSIGASLSAVKFSMENAFAQMKAGAGNLESLVYCIRITQLAIEEVRRICMDLRPAILDDLGIIATIDWFCKQFRNIHPKMFVHEKIRITEGEIPEPLKIVIFRIIQESLHNIAKHSKARGVSLSVSKVQDGLHLVIEDNGVGFDPNMMRHQKTFGRGLGLISMRERTEISGGSFMIESSPGVGTTVRACWASLFSSPSHSLQ